MLADLKKRLGNAGDKLTDMIATVIDKEESKQYMKELKLEQCVSWIKEMKAEYPSAASCIIMTKEAINPKTKEEGVSVTLIMMDKDKKPVALDKERAVSTIFLAETIDNGLINILNGEKSAVIKL